MGGGWGVGGGLNTANGAWLVRVLAGRPVGPFFAMGAFAFHGFSVR